MGVVDLRAGAELQEAAGICSDDGLGASGFGVAHFISEQFERCLGLRDVIDAGRATTNFRVGQFHKFKIGDGAQECARSFADFLSVEEVARVLIGDAERERLKRNRKAEGGEEFSDVTNFFRKCAGWSERFLVRREKVIVFLERGAAAGGVGEDGVEMFPEEGSDIFARQVAGGFTNASVRGQRTAAKLAIWHDDFTAVGGEHADGGFVKLREGDIGDATCEEGDTRAARANRGESLAEAVEEE